MFARTLYQVIIIPCSVIYRSPKTSTGVPLGTYAITPVFSNPGRLRIFPGPLPAGISTTAPELPAGRSSSVVGHDGRGALRSDEPLEGRGSDVLKSLGPLPSITLSHRPPTTTKLNAKNTNTPKLVTAAIIAKQDAFD